MTRWNTRLWALTLMVGLAASGLSSPAHAADDDFLPAEKAFPLAARVVDPQRLELRFDIAPGYYLYRDKFSVKALPETVRVGELQLPPAKTKYDENFQKDVDYYVGSTRLLLSVPAGSEPLQLAVGNQGCADKGLCYPPMKRNLRVERSAAGLLSVSLVAQATSSFSAAGLAGDGVSRSSGAASPLGLIAGGAPASAPTANSSPTKSPVLARPEAQQPPHEATPASAVTSASAAAQLPSDGLRDVAPPSALASPAPTKANAAPSASDAFSRMLASGSVLAVVAGFALAGLLLSFTPCMYPMYPILSSIVVGQQVDQVTRRRGFLLALAYSQGMALVYTALGVAAALIGGGLAAAFQNPWVLGAFGLLLVAFALAMFDVFELQVPQTLQGRLSEWSNGIQGGRYLGVFVMGMLSGLIVGPCIGPPLAGALFYIGQTRDVATGAVALYAMALGMSVPLLLIGVSAGAVLPRAGGWMRHVKHFFGVLLLAAALWMVSPVIPVWLVMLLAALLLLVVGVYLGAFEPLHGHPTPGRTFVKGLGLGLAALAAMLILGVMSGGRSVLQPLAHWSTPSAALSPSVRGAGVGGALSFTTVPSVAALQAAVRASGRPVMVDFYADWCVACKELETLTFTDERVRAQLAGMTLLRVDLTANSADDAALLRHFQLFGPPALLFFPAGGEAEVPGSRVIGFKNADDFTAHLAQVEALLRAAGRS